MRHTQAVHLEAGDRPRIWEHEGRYVLEIGDGLTMPFRLFATLDQLEAIAGAIDRYIHDHDLGPDGSIDYVDIVPAEAVVDADDLLAGMASDLHVEAKRDEFYVPPIEVGRRNCPKEVP